MFGSWPVPWGAYFALFLALAVCVFALAVGPGARILPLLFALAVAIAIGCHVLLFLLACPWLIV